MKWNWLMIEDSPIYADRIIAVQGGDADNVLSALCDIGVDDTRKWNTWHGTYIRPLLGDGYWTTMKDMVDELSR